MPDNRIIERHGETIDLGASIVGRNLNLVVVRGFAPMDILAEISAADVYDMVDNKSGTQRDLKSKHAEECFDYAIGSLGIAGEDEPRAFPEIVLNVRDMSVIEVYNLDDPGDLYELTSFSDEGELPSAYVGIRVLARDLEFPKPAKSPQISRVDGNHRLHETDEVLDSWWKSGETEDLDHDFPSVPFTLMLRLDDMQEARLFRDINGEHVGMETAHLDTLKIRTGDHDKMKMDPRNRALWLAYQLTEPERAFEGMVFFGGAKTGLKKGEGKFPPIRINALKTTIAAQLKAAPTTVHALQAAPEELLELLDRFWKAVKESFPDAWQEKKDYILLQAIGLGGFAKFGGAVRERAADANAVSYDDFLSYLTPVKETLSLRREEYPGIAGAGGAQYVADQLEDAGDPDKVKKQQLIKLLSGNEQAPTSLD